MSWGLMQNLTVWYCHCPLSSGGVYPRWYNVYKLRNKSMFAYLTFQLFSTDFARICTFWLKSNSRSLLMCGSIRPHLHMGRMPSPAHGGGCPPPGSFIALYITFFKLDVTFAIAAFATFFNVLWKPQMSATFVLWDMILFSRSCHYPNYIYLILCQLMSGV